MTAMFGEKVMLGQANGPEVELVVSGTRLYATYETKEGYPAVYDERLGIFCYARLVDGAFVSTAVAVTAPPPSGLELHAREADQVRAEKIRQRQQSIEQNAAKRPG